METLRKFFGEYIDGTPAKAVVADKKMFLCHLTKAVIRGINIDENLERIYINSRCVKHLYDRKPAEEFMFILDNLHKIVKYPDKIYNNRDGKRGEFCFVKNIGDSNYICSIEIIQLPKNIEGEEMQEIQVVTAFRLRDNEYIKKYTLLWSWEDDNSPS